MDNIIKPMTFDLKDLEGKAKNGDKLACYILGRSYDSEENGAEQSYEKAMYWYEKGKELGDPCCTYGVGACYYFGDGVEQDKEKAKQIHINAYKPLLELIEKEKENPRKQSFPKFCLGAYYYFGFGDIERDEKKAFEDYQTPGEDSELSDAQKAERSNVKGVWFEEDYLRTYPFNDLAWRWNRKEFKIIRILFKNGS